MFRKKRIFYRLISLFLIFAFMIVVPYSFTVITQVRKLIQVEEHTERGISENVMELHRELVPRLVERMVPYVFYILVLAFLLSIFFLRRLIIPLELLKKGSMSLKEGNLDIELKVTSEDELGDVTKAFNEMAASLKKMTGELRQKDVYINAMLDPFWVIDENNNIVDINPAFTRLLGYEKEEVAGESAYVFFKDEDRSFIRDQIENGRSRERASTCEVDILRKYGSPIPVLISMSPVHYGEKVIGLIGILKDFREEKELRNELERSKEYVETIMDSIEDRIIVIGKDYRIIKANEKALMDSRGPVIGEYCYAVAHGMDRPCWSEGRECPARAVFISGKNYRTIHKHEGLNDEVIFHEIVASPIKDASGGVVQVIELIRDITERMKYEEEVSRKNRELVALNDIAGLLSRSLRPEEIFSRVLDKVIEMIGMDGGGIFVLDDLRKEMICRYHRGISDEFVKFMGRIRVGDDIPGKVAATGEMITTRDLSKDLNIERSIIKHSGIKGYCCVPIRGKEKITGVFCLFSFRSHVFTVEEENILEAVGEMTGIALENMSLYESMKGMYERQRKRKEEEQAQLLSLSSRLGSAIELGEVLADVLDKIRNIFSAKFTWLLVNDRDGNLVVKSSSPAVVREGRIVFPRGVSSIEGYSVEKKSPVVISDISYGEKFYIPAEISDMSFQSAVSLPMRIGEKSIGVFSLYYQQAREFKDDELHFLRIISNFLAVAVERSDYYVRAIMEKGLSDTILQSVADGIITVDVSGRTISVNKAFETMFGVPSAEAVGLPVCDTIKYRAGNLDFRLSLAECMEEALSGKRTSREAPVVTASGKRTSVVIRSSPVINAEGAVIGVVNLIRDVSREKEIDRMKTEIIKSVSHEFRTPLSAIVGMTEMILDEDVEKDRSRNYLNTILSEGIRLSNMVSDLLSISRIEGGKESLSFGKIDLRHLMDELIRAYAAIIENKKAKVGYDIDGINTIVGDEGKIRQLLMNLVDNALMFSDEGCEIWIKVRERESGAQITVSDNGWGVSPEDLPHLTERFFRGRHGEKIKGTGLGLSLCSEIVEMHGGSMEIKSKPGEGTQVIVSLPSRLS
jgi:PAS domain S-box-containing protein